MKEKERHLLILSILFLIVNGVLFWKLGVSVDDDTERFLTYAEEIKERGIFFKPHDFWYIAYPLFIILMTGIHDSLGMVVLGQVALSYIALISLYASGMRLFGNLKAGLVTGMMFLGFFMISFWNFWIYCESLLISLNCLSIYFLIRWVKGEGNLGNYIIGALVIIAAFFTKPTGIALLAGIGLMIFYWFWKEYSNKTIKYGLLTVFFIGFVLLLNHMLSTFTFVRDYQIGELIYNAHTLPNQPYTKYLMISQPENLYIPPSDWQPLVQFIAIIFGNPLYSLKLFSAKLFYYLFYVRPYYSPLHNLLALLVLIPVYVGFIWAFKKDQIPASVRVFVLGFIGVSVLSSTLLTVDWNSRFLVAVLPLIFLIAAKEIGNNVLLLFQKTRV
jgi:4-amino-4-deoxy-L-arabinose transferase-like glycosyltransferase